MAPQRKNNSPPSASPYFVGVDLGGTKIAMGLIAGERVVQRLSVPVPATSTPKELVSLLIQSVKRLMGTETPCGLGMGVPGQIDGAGKRVIFAPNLKKWRDVPLASLLETGLGFPCFLTNDVRAATLGEWQFGAGRGLDSLLNLFLGTGVGGGLILNGKLWGGAHNIAGEVGHIKVGEDPQGPRCGCGGRNCLEAYVGGRGLARRFLKLLRHHGQKISPGRVDGKFLVTLASQKDRLALAHLDEMGMILGATIANLVMTLNPAGVLIGGGLLPLFPWFEKGLKRALRARVLPAHQRELQLLSCILGTDAGLLGAAVLAAIATHGAAS